MSDLEITKLCAEAMGLHEHIKADRAGLKGPALWLFKRDVEGWSIYNPLHDDAQTMALVKKFWLEIYFPIWAEGNWVVTKGAASSGVWSKDLNRAICECVAKMQSTKKEST